MLTKSYAKNGKTCKVTFKIPAELGAQSGAVLGEFNDWQGESHPLTKRKDGSLTATISLEAGKEYRFRYLLDGDKWLNDEAPDGFAPNRYGGQDCVVSLIQTPA
jgi:1,4-alpha-glucan branching enzyme